MDKRYINWIARKAIAMMEEDPTEERQLLRVLYNNPEMAENVVRNMMCGMIPLAIATLGPTVFYNTDSETAEVIRIVRLHFERKAVALSQLR